MSLATFLATPDKPEEVSEDPQPDPGIVERIWRTRAVVNNFGYTVKEIVDNQNKTAGCINNTFRSVADWAQNLVECLAKLENGGGSLGPPGENVNRLLK